MRSLQDHLEKKQTAVENRSLRLFQSLRDQVIEECFRRVNYDRVREGYKPLSKKVYAVKIGHIKSDMDLHYLLKQMQNSTNPGKVFFGCLKVKKSYPQA